MPFLPEDQADSLYSMPTDGIGKGKVHERPRCYGCFHEKHVYECAKDYEASVTRRMKHWSEIAKQQRETDSDAKV